MSARQTRPGQAPRKALNDAATVTALFDAHQRYAMRVAGQMLRGIAPGHRANEAEGVRNAALTGLWRSAKLFDATKGLRFLTYATRRIQGEIQDYLRTTYAVEPRLAKRLLADGIRIPSLVSADREIAQTSGRGGSVLFVKDVLPDPKSADRPRLDAEEEVNGLLKKLTAQERFVVIAYGIHDRGMKDVGLELGVSESRVCQIWHGALAKLRGHA